MALELRRPLRKSVPDIENVECRLSRSGQRSRRAPSSAAGLALDSNVHTIVPFDQAHPRTMHGFMNIELRVVQSDFMQIELVYETNGIRVANLSSGSVAGLKSDDLITKVDGVSVNSK